MRRGTVAVLVSLGAVALVAWLASRRRAAPMQWFPAVAAGDVPPPLPPFANSSAVSSRLQSDAELDAADAAAAADYTREQTSYRNALRAGNTAAANAASDRMDAARERRRVILREMGRRLAS